MKILNLIASSFALLCLLAQPSAANPFQIPPTVPEIDIQQPTGNSLEDGLTKVAFGTVTIGDRGKPKTFRIKNTGNGKLTGLLVTRKGVNEWDFKVIQAPQTSLAPGTSTTFTVTFKPSGKGSRTATIHIKSNDADEGSFDLKLAGRGQIP